MIKNSEIPEEPAATEVQDKEEESIVKLEDEKQPEQEKTRRKCCMGWRLFSVKIFVCKDLVCKDSSL